MIYIWILVTYVLTVWVGLRIIVPHLGFRKSALPESLPHDFAATIQRLSGESSDDYEFLRKSYEYVTSRYHGSRIRTLSNFWVAFQDPIEHAPGFLPCTSMNYILRTMLVKSGRFTEEDIEVKVIPLNIFIHQYLHVRVEDRKINVDPWSAFRGLPLGTKSAFIG
jgi:hypothetical protein